MSHVRSEELGGVALVAFRGDSVADLVGVGQQVEGKLENESACGGRK